MYPDKSKIYLYKGNHKSQTYGEIESNRRFEFGGDCYDGNDGVAIGIGLLLTAIIIGITDSALSFIAFALGFVVGLALLIYAGAKYNR